MPLGEGSLYGVCGYYIFPGSDGGSTDVGMREIIGELVTKKMLGSNFLKDVNYSNFSFLNIWYYDQASNPGSSGEDIFGMCNGIADSDYTGFFMYVNAVDSTTAENYYNLSGQGLSEFMEPSFGGTYCIGGN